MTFRTRISIDGLSDEIIKAVKEYEDNAVNATARAAENTAKRGVETLKKEGAYKNRSGKYRKSFRIDNFSTRLRPAYVIRAGGKEYRLSHLLEKGHVIKRKGRIVGRASAFPHWEPSREKIEEDFRIRLIEELSNERS